MKILFIGSRLFDDVAWYLKQEEITSIITESNANANADNLELADKKYIVKRGMNEPKDIALKEDVDAIIPLIGIDPPLADVGKLKDEMQNYGIPVIAANEATATLAADKFNTKQTLEKNKIKTPKYSKVDSVNDIKNLPVVLKTPEGQGGVGVKIVLKPSDIDEFMDGKSNVFMEEYVEGFETSIEVLRYNGITMPLTPVYKGVTTLTGVHPLSKIKKAPLNIEGLDNLKHNESIRNLAFKIADLVGVEGTMDIDILHNTNTNEDYVIELNTRPSGTRYMSAATTDIYPLCQLIDMASGKFKKQELKNYLSAEIPIGNFPEDKFEKRKYFTSNTSFIVHGPKNYQRVTLRAKTKEDLNALANDLIPEYMKENNIIL